MTPGSHYLLVTSDVSCHLKESASKEPPNPLESTGVFAFEDIKVKLNTNGVAITQYTE